MSKDTKSSEALLARAYELSNDQETKALYRDWAQTYDETMLKGLSYLTPQKTAQLFSDYVAIKTCRILDVGSGTGLAGQMLAQLGYSKIDALDYSSEMLGVAKARTHNKKPVYQNLIKADLNKPLSIAANTYEGMIATGVFTHAHVGANCLSELFRVLKPGSLFATTVHKDVWESAGFEKTVGELEAAGTIKTRYSKMGRYFETDKEPAGYYIIWENLK